MRLGCVLFCFLFPFMTWGWEECAYPILLATDDGLEPVGVVDRFGTIQCARGVYVYPPSFADGADSGWAIRRRDGVVVHVDKAGNECFELPKAWFADVHPWAVYANISEGELVCFIDALKLPKVEERRYVCVNSRGRPSREYEGNGTAFYHGRAVVRRDGWVYLLDHDYREVPVCRDVEGITVGEFWNGLYAVLVFRHPRSKVWDKVRRREEWTQWRSQLSRNRRIQSESGLRLTEEESIVPALEDWPWAYDTVRILNRFGERVAEFPLVKDDGNTYGLLRCVSSKGCFVPVLDAKGRAVYRYYLFAERRYLKDFACERILGDGFQDDAMFVQIGDAAFIFDADGRLVRLDEAYSIGEEGPSDFVSSGFHYGHALMQRCDGSRVFIDKNGAAIKEIPGEWRKIEPIAGCPLWEVHESLSTTRCRIFFLDRQLNVIDAGDLLEYDLGSSSKKVGKGLSRLQASNRCA